MKFIITGTGRCGTGFMSKVVGCGHEEVFGVDGPGAFKEGDSSWMAAPYLQDYSCPKIHVVRDPADVLPSLYGCKGLFVGRASQYGSFINRWGPRDVYLFYEAWTAHCDRECDLIVKVEDPDYSAIDELLGVECSRVVPEGYNRRVATNVLDVDTGFVSVARERYGYSSKHILRKRK
tara:strand:- start:617 stop:1147 length:531 start_codon:yes stop_codon:yes gene_type:complete